MRGPRVVRRGLRRVLGPKFVKHYVRPRRIAGRQVPYDAKRYFEAWHGASPASLFDADTIAAGRGAPATRFHYNAVENSVIECPAAYPCRILSACSTSAPARALDRLLPGRLRRGRGRRAGALAAVGALERRYAGVPRVTIVEGDVADPGFALEGEFEVVNAIGVMFDIVEDERWEAAVAKARSLLAEDGARVVGGHFGLLTQNVQVHRTGSFSSWEELRSAQGETALVNKRIRSLRRWRRCARGAGLRVACLRRTRRTRRLETPKNNVLVLVRDASGAPASGGGRAAASARASSG